jgi:peptidoglycan/LPS O-acetylase OafA/YrhL
MSVPATPPRSNAVVGLRGLTVIAIMAHHYMPADFFSFNVAKAFNALLIAIGGYFFAGFMLREESSLDSGSVRDRAGAVARLLARQVLRVWPLLAFVIALYVVLAYVDGGELTTQILSTWWLYLIDLGNAPKVMYGAQAFPAHFWTIAAQDQVILVIGLGMIVSGLSGLRRALPWLVVGGLVARIAAILAFMPDSPALALEMPWSVLDIACVGMLARLAVDDASARGRIRRSAYTGALVVGLAWVVLPNTNAAFYGLVPLCLALLAVGLVLTATDDMRADALTRAICHPALNFLGTIALSLFFLHPFVNTVLVLSWPHLTGSVMPWWAFAIVGPAVAIPCAWAMHVFVERPLLSARSRRTSAPRLAAA